MTKPKPNNAMNRHEGNEKIEKKMKRGASEQTCRGVERHLEKHGSRQVKCALIAAALA
jgi:hypothetical protein